MPASLTLSLPDESATAVLAQRLAGLLTAPPTPGGRVYLRGELGAGKTTLVRALLRAGGVTGRVKSPSYALVESYKVFNLYFHHFDFYRFNDPREWLDAGFRDLLMDGAVVLVEWPERVAGLLPAPDLEVILAYGAGNTPGRIATVRAQSGKGQTWLQTLTDFSAAGQTR